MASNARNRNQRYSAGNRRGLGVGWTLFSIVMVAAILAMGIYGWNALRAGDAIASSQLNAAAEQAPPAVESNEATAVPEAAEATAVPPQEAATDASALIAETPDPSLETEAPVDAEPVASPEWPAQQFPSVPAFPSASYATYLDGGHADIQLPAGSESGFKSYAAQLVAGGASIYVDNGRLTVLALGDVEIQLITSEDSPSISLCGESAISWEDTGDVLPQSGRLVSWEPGEDGMGALLTYRCVSLSGLMDYLDLLRREGWTSSDQASPVNGTYYATYQRGDRTATVDYYANSTNFQISLGTKIVQ